MKIIILLLVLTTAACSQTGASDSCADANYYLACRKVYTHETCMRTIIKPTTTCYDTMRKNTFTKRYYTSKTCI